MKNIIAFQKGGVVPVENKWNLPTLAQTTQANLMQFGYVLSEKAYSAVSHSTKEWVTNFNEEVIGYIHSRTGGSGYTPFYKNFPQQVLGMGAMETLYNAILHYWSEGTWEPYYEEIKREVGFEYVNYTVLDLFSEEDFTNIFTNLVTANTSLSNDDKKAVEWFLDNGYVPPKNIPFKETLCMLIARGAALPSNVNDILRTAVYMSGGDVSMATSTKFRNFTRVERRFIISLFQDNSDIRDMVKFREQWLRLGEKIHFGEYFATERVFNELRNTRVRTWQSEVNNTKRENLCKKLLERPGEFMRRLDWLIREEIPFVFNNLPYALSYVSNKVLFETYQHFLDRDNRRVTNKGARRGKVIKAAKDIPATKVNRVLESIKETLQARFSEKSLGKVWVDERLKFIPIPTNMRSLSDSLKPVVRGMRMPFEADTLRFYVHWDDPAGCKDYDLSATLYGLETEVLNWQTALDGLKVGLSCHSGDVRMRQGKCAEYIDISVSNAMKRGFSHVLIDVRDYNGTGWSDVFAGYMQREQPEKNDLWLPATVENAIPISVNSRGCIVALVDLVNKQVVWVDEDTEGAVSRGQDVEAVMAYIKPPKFSVYDLIMLHRADFVNRDEADTEFTFEEFSKNYTPILKLMQV